MSSRLRVPICARVSSPSLKITIRLPAASRKLKALKSAVPSSMARPMIVPWSGNIENSTGSPMRLMLSRMLS